MSDTKVPALPINLYDACSVAQRWLGGGLLLGGLGIP